MLPLQKLLKCPSTLSLSRVPAFAACLPGGIHAKSVQCVRLVNDQIGEATPSEAVDGNKHIFKGSKAGVRVRPASVEVNVDSL